VVIRVFVGMVVWSFEKKILVDVKFEIVEVLLVLGALVDFEVVVVMQLV